jgi:hypothetical protein
MNLCKYKNLFGEPGTGMHSIRIFDIAIIHIIILLIEAIVIHQIFIVMWLKLDNIIKLWMIILFLFIFGIIIHRIFCVRTTVDKWLFKD